MLNMILLAAMSMGLATDTPQEHDAAVPLSEAVQAFNAGAIDDAIGSQQPLLTEDEVVGAILLWDRTSDTPVSDPLLARFKSIARTKELPQGSVIEAVSAFDRGGEHVFDVWSVRIRLKRGDGSSFGFVIRERVVASRTLQQELDRLEAMVAAEPDLAHEVGGHGTMDRVDELKKRIARLGN